MSTSGWLASSTYIVNKTKTGCGCELGPVGGLLEPVQVLSQEHITRRTKVHQTVGNDSRIVHNRVAAHLLRE